MKIAIYIALGLFGLIVALCAAGLAWLWAATDIDRYGDDE